MKVLSEKYRGIEVSHATLRPEDLIPAFLEFMESVIPEMDAEYADTVKGLKAEAGKLYIEYREGYGSEYADPGEASYFLNEPLFLELNAIAPVGTYFGSSDGDGSSFGFWEIEDDGTF